MNFSDYLRENGAELKNSNFQVMAGIPSSIVKKGAPIIEISNIRQISKKNPDSDICIVKNSGKLEIAFNSFGVRWDTRERSDLVIMEGPVIVGVLVGSLLSGTQLYYEVDYVHVDAKYQNKGVGSLMADALIKKLVMAYNKVTKSGKKVKDLTLETNGTSSAGKKWMLHLKRNAIKALPDIPVKLRSGPTD